MILKLPKNKIPKWMGPAKVLYQTKKYVYVEIKNAKRIRKKNLALLMAQRGMLLPHGDPPPGDGDFYPTLLRVQDPGEHSGEK